MTPQQQEVHLKLVSLLPSRVHYVMPPPPKTGRVSVVVYMKRKKRAKQLIKTHSVAEISKLMGLARQTIYNLIRRP